MATTGFFCFFLLRDVQSFQLFVDICVQFVHRLSLFDGQLVCVSQMEIAQQNVVTMDRLMHWSRSFVRLSPLGEVVADVAHYLHVCFCQSHNSRQQGTLEVRAVGHERDKTVDSKL